MSSSAAPLLEAAAGESEADKLRKRQADEKREGIYRKRVDGGGER